MTVCHRGTPTSQTCSGTLSEDWFSECHKAVQTGPSLLASKGLGLSFSRHCGFLSGHLSQGSQIMAWGSQYIRSLPALTDRVSLTTTAFLHLYCQRLLRSHQDRAEGLQQKPQTPRIFNAFHRTSEGPHFRCQPDSGVQHTTWTNSETRTSSVTLQSLVQNENTKLCLHEKYYEFQGGKSRAVNQVCVKPGQLAETLE